MQRMIIVMLAALLALAQPTSGGFQQNADYSRESRAAMGAHHLCSGLWVVGRVYQRTPEEVLAQDIAPFAAFSWEESFKYNVDAKRRREMLHGCRGTKGNRLAVLTANKMPGLESRLDLGVNALELSRDHFPRGCTERAHGRTATSSLRHGWRPGY